MQFVINSPNSPIFLSIFNINIRYYGIILAVSIAVGLIVCYKLFLKIKDKEESEFFVEYMPILVLVSILGARLFYVIGNLNFYLLHKEEIILINHGGLSIWGGIIIGIISLFLYLKLKKKDILLHFDIISSTIPLCQAIGRFGNYFNQEAFGLPTNSFIKLYVDKSFRPDSYLEFDYFHPAFLYESILDILIFLILMFLIGKRNKLKPGTIFCLYIILYSLARILVETIRIDSINFVFSIPVASIISMVMALISVIILFILYKK